MGRLLCAALIAGLVATANHCFIVAGGTPHGVHAIVDAAGDPEVDLSGNDCGHEGGWLSDDGHSADWFAGETEQRARQAGAR